MHRLPLTDQLPYTFHRPTIQPFWLFVGRFYIDYLMRRQQRVQELEFAGVEHLTPLLDRGDGVMIAPNHADHADCGVVFELARRLKQPFYYMAAYQIFTGIGRIFLPKLGAFPVDREGTDLTAFKTAVEILGRGREPLVIFPEGEIYFQSDRLTPLREGAAVMAATAAKQLAKAGKTVWIVPAGIKYRFLDGHDPMPEFVALMDRLESRFTWRRQSDRPVIERIYRFAEGMLGLKELEYLGAVRPGPLTERIAHLRDTILNRLEERWGLKNSEEPVPMRIKELRRACLNALADPAATPERAAAIRRDLDDIFGALQLFSYPGNYLRECPTLERAAEILLKMEEDVEGVHQPSPKGPRRAILKLGPPINVKTHLDASGGKLRAVGPALTSTLETRIQELLDAIGPGRPLPPPVTPALAETTLAQNSSA
jgi:1-acyl-sn-glycerol-3-phosphate acyltransferase